MIQCKIQMICLINSQKLITVYVIVWIYFKLQITHEYFNRPTLPVDGIDWTDPLVGVSFSFYMLNSTTQWINNKVWIEIDIKFKIVFENTNLRYLSNLWFHLSSQLLPNLQMFQYIMITFIRIYIAYR